jgi:flagellar capping protein FliD
VSAFFTGTAQSLSDRYTTYLDGITATTGAKGSLTTLTNSLASRSTSLDTQIAAAERRLKTERALLETKFIQMEQAQATFQKQGQIISRSFSA